MDFESEYGDGAGGWVSSLLHRKITARVVVAPVRPEQKKGNRGFTPKVAHSSWHANNGG